MEKSTLLAMLVLASVAFLQACASFEEGGAGRSVVEATTIRGGGTAPEPSEGFTPTEIIQAPANAVFAAAIEVLDNDRVPILNENIESGRINTDYVAGPTYYSGFGLLGSNSTRYKYTVLVREAENGTKLSVAAYLESSGSSIQSWIDVSADNQSAVQSLQNALIEKIEKELAVKSVTTQ